MLDGIGYHALLSSAYLFLEREKEKINQMNVFPVPDGDTGTNMSLTLSAIKSISPSRSLGQTAEAVSKAMLNEARGNSGAILSLFFRGFAKTLRGKNTASAKELSKAFSEGTDEAYRAVASPKEGTVLSVMRASAEALQKAVKRAPAISLQALLEVATEAAAGSVRQTPKLLPILKEAGVLDAGGYGFYIALQGMLSSFEGKEIGSPVEVSLPDPKSIKGEHILFPYCTECSVETNKAFSETEARKYLSSLGDSLVLIKEGKTVKIHLHTSAPDKVLSYALSFGTLVAVKVENMQKQHEDVFGRGGHKRYGFVSVFSGEGIKEAFLSLGTDAVVDGGETMSPSAVSIANAASGIDADTVFILPNSKNLRLTAERAAEALLPRRVIVIPTESVPEGMSVMLAVGEDDREPELEKRIERARSTVSSMAVAEAARPGTVGGRKIQKGEYLGLVEGEIACTGKSRLACIHELSRGMTGASFVTLFYGKSVEEAEAQRASLHIKEKVDRDCEVNLLYGGQPIYDYIASVEYK